MTTKPKAHQRGFRIVEFRNRAGSVSYRCIGWIRGRRIRENFSSLKAAEARRLELDGERLGQRSPEVLRATWLTAEQLKACEWACFRLPEPDDLRRAVEWWQDRGQAQSDATRHAEDIRLDDAVKRFGEWLDKAPLRPHTVKNLKTRIKVFASEVGDVPLASITPEIIEAWLDSRKAAPVTKDNDRRSVSRFLAWCCERRQRFLVVNPCSQVRVDLPEKGPPEIYTLKEIMRLLAAGRRVAGGRFLKAIVLGLFASMRPSEALAFRDEQLVDGEIRIEACDSKLKRARTIAADPVLVSWLRQCPSGPVTDWTNHRVAWASLLRKAKLGRWIADGLRHTSLSHFFRRCGSYGLTAEHGGNSEAVIKAHYQARTSAADSNAFWTLFPDRADRRRARLALKPRKLRSNRVKVIRFPGSQSISNGTKESVR